MVYSWLTLFIHCSAGEIQYSVSLAVLLGTGENSKLYLLFSAFQKSESDLVPHVNEASIALFPISFVCAFTDSNFFTFERNEINKLTPTGLKTQLGFSLFNVLSFLFTWPFHVIPVMKTIIFAAPQNTVCHSQPSSPKKPTDLPVC